MTTKNIVERINRNILECKSQSARSCGWCDKVLIETYWNVNTSRACVTEGGDLVLIETYWNVNHEVMSKRSKLNIGINRNILECK